MNGKYDWFLGLKEEIVQLIITMTIQRMYSLQIYINNTKISGSGIATISSEQMSMYVELNASKSFKGDDLFQSICNVSTKMSAAGKSIAVTAELSCKSYRDVEAFELPDVTDYTEDTTISHSDVFSSAL